MVYLAEVGNDEAKHKIAGFPTEADETFVLFFVRNFANVLPGDGVPGIFLDRFKLTEQQVRPALV